MTNYNYINNFRLVYEKCTEKMPPELVEYKILSDYQIYYSTFNNKLFIIFDHIKKLYCSFENNGDSTEIDLDLLECIKRIR